MGAFNKHERTQAAGLRYAGLSWLTTVDGRLPHPPTRTPQTGYSGGEWGDRERGLSWVVVSCHDAELCFWTWAIFQRGKGGHLVSLPLWPPPSVATSQLSPKISTDPSMSGALVIKYIDGATKHHLWEEEERCAAAGHRADHRSD